jgi:GNAT superfamily N-acetyltransferase
MKNNNLHIRRATTDDLRPLYDLGLATPEFKVSGSHSFMEEDEFLSAIADKDGVFLMAEDNGRPVGFVYANWRDMERGPTTHWACLVYLVVDPSRRRAGIAQRLYDACLKELVRAGVRHVYGWANAESDGAIISFMRKNGFAGGHKYLWMDKEIQPAVEGRNKPPRIYVTTSFGDSRDEVERLCAAVRAAGFEDFSFIRDVEDFQKVFDRPAHLMRRAMEEIAKSDALLIDMTDKPTGRAIEAGMAYALGKKVIVIMRRGTAVKDTTRGIADVIIEYDEIGDIAAGLMSGLQSWGQRSEEPRE